MLIADEQAQIELLIKCFYCYFTFDLLLYNYVIYFTMPGNWIIRPALCADISILEMNFIYYVILKCMEKKCNIIFTFQLAFIINSEPNQHRSL